MTSSSPSPSEDPSLSPSSLNKGPVLYCICGYGDGEMIGCDGDRCPGNGWFHMECLGINYRYKPRGIWMCPHCTERHNKSEQRRLKRSLYKTDDTSISHIDDSEFITNNQKKKKTSGTEDLPLKVTAAERQSRQEMEQIAPSARLIRFHESGENAGRAVVDSSKGVTSFPHGLCRASLSKGGFKGIRSLHSLIVRMLRRGGHLTPWAGVAESDARKRGYAFLPSCFGKFGKAALRAAGLRFHAFEKRGREAQKDEASNWASCIRLAESDLTPSHIAALEEIIEWAAAAVPVKYRECITLENLQALQPNLHSGQDHLPPHMDAPLNDGFGVVIVTVCIRESGRVLLLPDEAGARPRAWVFDAPQGDMYVLSDAARNSFDHGVLCELGRRSKPSSAVLAMKDEEQGKNSLGKKKRAEGNNANHSRESLNLRFGIHGSKPGMRFYVGEELPMFL